MKRRKIIIALLSSIFLFNACTSEEQAFVGGVAIGALAVSSLSSYSYPRYYNQPYYYHGGRYYYGGRYSGGYYHYRGHRYRSGHYYRGGNRYHNGRRYSVQNGKYGYYSNRSSYNKSLI